MNLTQLQRSLKRRTGRVKRYVKKIKKLSIFKQASMLVLTAPLLIPVGAVAAAYQPDTAISTEPIATFEVELALGSQEIVAVPGKTIKIELQESEYQAKQKKIIVTQTAKTVVAASTKTSDPGFEVKRSWAQKAAAAHGIDWKLLEAVWQIESGKQWYTTVRSYAGARGPCQFMPGTWRGYAQDGNGDGVKNIDDARDCLFASAKLLARNGAASGDHRRALFAYNHSNHYVNTVLGIAERIQ